MRQYELCPRLPSVERTEGPPLASDVLLILDSPPMEPPTPSFGRRGKKTHHRRVKGRKRRRLTWMFWKPSVRDTRSECSHRSPSSEKRCSPYSKPHCRLPLGRTPSRGRYSWPAGIRSSACARGTRNDSPPAPPPSRISPASRVGRRLCNSGLPRSWPRAPASSASTSTTPTTRRRSQPRITASSALRSWFSCASTAV